LRLPSIHVLNKAFKTQAPMFTITTQSITFVNLVSSSISSQTTNEFEERMKFKIFEQKQKGIQIFNQKMRLFVIVIPGVSFES
jgi:TATA-binding protein-associated factor Taf7